MHRAGELNNTHGVWTHMGKYDMSLVINLSNNLKRIRLEKGFTQERFAEILDLHTNYYSSIERAERNPTLRVVEQINIFIFLDLG